MTAALSLRLEQVRGSMASGAAGATDEDLIRQTNAVSRAVSTLDRIAQARRRDTAPAGADALRAYLAARPTEAAA